MRYTDLLRACGGDAWEALYKARAAARLPYTVVPGRTPKMAAKIAAKKRAVLRDSHPVFAPLLHVKRRVLKRWARRAAASLSLGKGGQS